MNRIVSLFGVGLILSCLAGCASTTTGKVGRGRVVVNTSAHNYQGFSVNPKNGERSVTLGVVTLGGDARLEDRQPRVLDLGFGVDVPAQTEAQ